MNVTSRMVAGAGGIVVWVGIILAMLLLTDKTALVVATSMNVNDHRTTYGWKCPSESRCRSCVRTGFVISPTTALRFRRQFHSSKNGRIRRHTRRTDHPTVCNLDVVAGSVVVPRRSLLYTRLQQQNDDNSNMDSFGSYEGSEGDGVDNDDDDDEDVIQKPYGRRSKAWTDRYRKLIPYEYARKTAMNLGLRSKEEWQEYLDDGKVYHGPYLVSRPDEMYAEEWVSWEEFLGIMRTYDDTKRLVTTILQLTSMEEYTAFIQADPKRAEGLRIPLKPNIVYKNKGWISEEAFFTKDEEYQDDGDYRCSM